MRQRSIGKMILLSIITLGIYSLYWSVSTKNEMNKLGANIPTAWLLIVPFVSIYWLWKYSEAVEQITHNKVSTPLAFIVEAFLGFIGDLVIQSEFNKLAAAPAGDAFGGSAPQAVPGLQPDNSFGGPVASVTPATPVDPVAVSPAPFEAPASPPAVDAPVAPTNIAPAPTPVTNPVPPTISVSPTESPTPPQTPPTVG